MRNLILAFACFSLFSCQELTSESEAAPSAKSSKKNGLVTTTNASTKVKNEVTFKDGVRHGPAKAYYPDGKIWKSNNYADGKLDGEAFIYFRNGKPKRASGYFKGIRDGNYTEYFKSGNPKLETSFDKGKPLLTYKDRDYKGELKPYPKITYSEHETMAEAGRKIVYLKAEISMPEDATPKALEFYLIPSTVDWNTTEVNDLIEYRMRPTSDSEAIAQQSLEPGEYSTFEGEIIAVFELKKDLPVATSRRLRLSFENL